MDLDEEIRSREEGEIGSESVGRREIYSPVPPPSSHIQHALME